MVDGGDGAGSCDDEHHDRNREGESARQVAKSDGQRRRCGKQRDQRQACAQPVGELDRLLRVEPTDEPDAAAVRGGDDPSGERHESERSADEGDPPERAGERVCTPTDLHDRHDEEGPHGRSVIAVGGDRSGVDDAGGNRGDCGDPQHLHRWQFPSRGRGIELLVVAAGIGWVGCECHGEILSLGDAATVRHLLRVRGPPFERSSRPNDGTVDHYPQLAPAV